MVPRLPTLCIAIAVAMVANVVVWPAAYLALRKQARYSAHPSQPQALPGASRGLGAVGLRRLADAR